LVWKQYWFVQNAVNKKQRYEQRKQQNIKKVLFKKEKIQTIKFIFR
jgi:hypothetical protein